MLEIILGVIITLAIVVGCGAIILINWWLHDDRK